MRLFPDTRGRSIPHTFPLRYMGCVLAACAVAGWVALQSADFIAHRLDAVTAILMP
jgi:hypothetical protein